MRALNEKQTPSFWLLFFANIIKTGNHHYLGVTCRSHPCTSVLNVHCTMRNVSIKILFFVCATAVAVCAAAPAAQTAVKSVDEQKFDRYVQHLQNEDGW